MDALQGEMPTWSSYNYGFCNPIIFNDSSGNQPDNQSGHTVKEGETLSGIAKKYNTTVAELYKNNSHLPQDATKLQIGEKVSINIQTKKDNEHFNVLLYTPIVSDVDALYVYSPQYIDKLADKNIPKKNTISNDSMPYAAEARVRAFLRMIRVGEGTVGEKGYETLFGGSSFIKDKGKDWSTHPQIKITKGKYTSSAAGAYQVMGYTWDDKSMIKYRNSYQISDFTPENQDKFAIVLLKHKRANQLPEKYIKQFGEQFREAYGDIIQMLIDGDIEKAIKTASLEWASLPGSPYGQPTENYSNAIKNYNKYLEQELSGKSDLHLKKGFLKQFGY